MLLNHGDARSGLLRYPLLVAAYRQRDADEPMAHVEKMVVGESLTRAARLETHGQILTGHRWQLSKLGLPLVGVSGMNLQSRLFRFDCVSVLPAKDL